MDMAGEDALLKNAYTRIVFRVGNEDAKKLATTLLRYAGRLGYFLARQRDRRIGE